MSNEITIELKCSIDEIQEILINKGFELIDKYEMNDIFYISNDVDMKILAPREILKSYMIIRNVKQYESSVFITYYNIEKIIYKQKNIALNGDIISQEKYDCEIKNQEQGKNLLSALGYKEIMTIKEKDVVYSNNEIDIAIKDVIDGYNLIEIECNNKFDTIEKIKQKIIELDLPIDKSDFFVKKAEIKLKEILGDLK